MGGRIDVESAPGRGSTFRVSVSLRRGQPLNLASADTAFDGAAETVAAGGRRILVAEDNEVNSTRARDADQPGPQQRWPATAWRPSPRSRPAVRPDANGYPDARHRRTRRHGDPRARWMPAIPIIALTANAMVEDMQAYLAAGINEHVAKPLEIGKLALAITRVLSLERQI